MADLVIRKQKCNLYAAEFKVISFAEESNGCAVSCQFKIYEKLIHDWDKNKAKLENIPKSKKPLQHGKLSYLELENL